MKIKLHFKQLTLGELTKVGEEYIYNSNTKGEDAFKKYATSSLYSLMGSNDLRSETLFDEFDKIVKDVRARVDIMLSAKISKNDDDFTVLKKFAFLSQNQDKYWVEVAV